MKQALNNGIKCNCKTTIRSNEDTDDKKETIQASFSFILYPNDFSLSYSSSSSFLL